MLYLLFRLLLLYAVLLIVWSKSDCYRTCSRGCSLY